MKATRLEALDAWRGICALLVALEHLSIDNPLHGNALIHHSYRFVDFFFVLSGFVIAHAYRDRLQSSWGEIRNFAIRRLGRLWPLHIVVLLAFVCFELVIALANHAHVPTGKHAFVDHDTVASLPANIVMVQSWGLLDHPTWNVPSWSISTEILAYAVFALACWWSKRWLVPVAAVLMVLGAAVVIVAAPQQMGSTFDYGVFRCVYGFMAGVLMRSLWGWFQLRVGTVGEICVIIGVFVGVALLGKDWPSVLITPIFAVAVWVFASEDGGVSRVLMSRGPQALGRWSYSIYMIHALIILVILAVAMLISLHGPHIYARVNDLPTIVGGPLFTAAFALGYLAVLIVASRATYRFIEVPGQRLAARLSRRSQ